MPTLDDLREKAEARLEKVLATLDERHKRWLRAEILQYGRVQDVPEQVWKEIAFDMENEQLAVAILLLMLQADDWTTDEIKSQGVIANRVTNRNKMGYALIAAQRTQELAAQTTRTLRDRLARKIEDSKLTGPGDKGELTKGGIDDVLDDVFNAQRRKGIATDQTTGSFSYGQRTAAQRAGGDGAQTTSGQRVEIELIWRTERDDIVCPRCAPLEGTNEETWGLVFPEGPGQEAHPNCLLPGQSIEGRVIGASKAFYCGQAIEFTTASGVTLSVTPNHPVLTKQGFVPANTISNGDKFIRYSGVIHLSGSRSPHNKHYAPALIEQVFSTLPHAGGLVRFNPSAVDFHGDAEFFAGDVEIKHSAWELLSDSPAAIEQFARERGLIGRNMELVCESCGRAFSTNSYRIGLTAASSPSLAELTTNGSGVALYAPPLDPLLLGGGAEACARFNQPAGDDGTTDGHFFSELINGLPGVVTADDVVDVRYFDYAGHVYDLQTVDGYFYSNGIITHNCRCFLQPQVVVTGDSEA